MFPLILAGFFNAVMDLLENENFHQSIFRNWNQKFWYKRESWKYAKKILGYKIDGWHLSKTAWAFSWVGHVIAIKMRGPELNTPVDVLMLVVLDGIVVNTSFEFFYQIMKR